jgi:hypothetical protein
LEHIPDPVGFIKLQSDRLTEHGKIIFSVPNCSPYLNEGDPSIFIHEHYSYFTEESIKCIANLSGLKLDDISTIEGAFIVTLCNRRISNFIESTAGKQKNEFTQKLDLHLNNLNKVIREYSSSNISVYSPVRAMNIFFLLGIKDIRLVDDNTEMQGKYLPFLSNKIESFIEICQKPPECLIIFSRTFGERIKQKCKLEKVLDTTRIITLSEIDLLK